MSNKNYTNYSKPKKEKPVEAVAPETTEENIQNIPETEYVEGLSDSEVSTETTTNTTPEVVTGTVVNCEQLNIRADSSLFSEVLCVINKGEEVEIIEEESTDTFYAIIYGKNKEVNVEGFCMKQYIKID